MLVAPDIPPGIYRQGTNYQAMGRYYDGDLIRFHEGVTRPVGGWVTQSNSSLSGKGRAIITWLDNSNQAWAGVGTHSNLYAVSRSGSVNDITPSGLVAGRADASLGGGYGVGPYGAELYGTPRLNSSNIIPASVWSLDTWGEYLVGTMGDEIYEWQLDTVTPADAIVGAPTAEAILVTEERIMFALGSDGDPRAVDWCDAEDNTDWTPSSTNLAGGKRLQTNGKLQCGKRVRGGYLLFTDVDVHLATYVGLPLVYSFERIATGCGVTSKGSVAVVDDKAFWMGANGFWSYNGFVDALPCEVSDYVFSDINTVQLSKVSAWHNSLWGEVWWHYPSAGSVENDRYVAFNYREGHWTIGELDRLAGADQGVLRNPILMGDDGYLYQHEVGNDYGGRQPFLTSGPVELGEGDRTMEVHAVIPDERSLGDVETSFYVGDRPMDATALVAAVTSLAKTDVRFSGRRVAVRHVAQPDADFRLGRFKYDVKAGAGR